MLGGTRRQLALVYAAFFFAAVLALIGGSYFGLVGTIDGQIDDDIEDAAGQLLADLEPFGELDVVERPSVVELAPRSFVLAMRADGEIVANPRNLEVADQHRQLVDRAVVADAPVWDSVTVGDQRQRVLAQPVASGGVVLSGRSLEFRDTRVQRIVFVLALIATSGLILSVGVSWMIAGSALRPTEQAFELQREFVADASHELRSPLAVIQTAADLLLRDDRLAADNREAVQDIHDVSVEAGTIVEDLLTLAGLQASGVPDGLQAIDLAEVAARELERIRPLLTDHDSAVHTSLLPAPAAAGPRESARVVRAALDNALVHTPPGTQVWVSTGLAGNEAFVTVEDDGPGVPDEYLDGIFGRFVQLADARTPTGDRGSGLGLAIVRAIAQRRGGQAIVQRSEHGGLRVYITFPSTAHPR